MAHNSMSASKEILSFDALIKFLEKVHNVVSECVVDENGNAKSVFFQDFSMKDMFNFFPERVCLDCTYKQFDIGLYMYIFICEDSNGKNIIVAVGFLQSNDINSLTWLLDTFKQHNPNHRRIKSLAVDFQIKQREFIRNFFPQALQIICFFHAYVCFKSDSKEFYSLNYITEEQMLYANDSFRNLYFAQNQAEFELRYALYSNLPPVLVSYLENVWMPYQQEWRVCLDYAHEDVFHNINFFLQDVSDAVASISAVNNNYVEFINDIFLFIALKKKDKLNYSPKPDTFLYSQFSSEYQIAKTLTPYAARFVIKQLDLSKDIICSMSGNNDAYIFNYLGLSISATINQCSCHFFLFTLLPCRHIFVARKMNHHCLFDDSLVVDDWNLKYYEHSIICMDSHIEKGTNRQIPKDEASRTFLARQIFGTSLLSILELPLEAFNTRMEELYKILEAWKTDCDVSLQFAGIDRSSISHKSSSVTLSKYSPNAWGINQFDNAIGLAVSKVKKFPSTNLRLNGNRASNSMNNFQVYEATTSETCMSSIVSDILSSNPNDACGIPSTSISACSIPSTSSGFISDDIVSTLKSLISSDIPSTSSPVFQFSATNISENVSFFEMNQCKKLTEKSFACDPTANNDASSKPFNRNLGFSVLKGSGVQAIDNASPFHILNPNVESFSHCADGTDSPSIGTSSPCALQTAYKLSNFNASILCGPVTNLACIVYQICYDKDECLAWLRKNSLMPTSLKCLHCGSVMACRSFPHTQDGSSWCCTRTVGKRCSKRQSIRVGTWFEIANMPIENLLVFCYLWINRFDRNIIIQVISVSTSNFVKLDKFLSRVCIHSVKKSLSDKDCSIYKSARDVWIEQNGGINADIFLPFLKAVSMVWKNEFLGCSVKSQQ